MNPDDRLPDAPAPRPEPDEEQATVLDPEVIENTAARAGRTAAVEVIHQSVSFRQAPYPTPADLREYEDIHPGFTERILTLTERETEHRIQQERFQDRSTVDIAKRGQNIALVVVMTLVVGSIAAILTDHGITGLAALVVAAATLAAAFIAPEALSRRAAKDDTQQQDTGEEPPGTDVEPE